MMQERDFNPARLALARRRRGLSQRGLAQQLGCTDRTVRRWEGGGVPPDGSNLRSLATALGYREEFFFLPGPAKLPVEAVSFRSLSKALARDRERMVAGGVLALELNDWLEASFELPRPNLPDLREQRGDPEAAAIALRTYWALGDRPISNMVALLEHQGIRVFSLAEDCKEIDAYSFWQGSTPMVFLNTLKSSEHARFDAAHELAHLVLHRHGGVPGRVEEKEANQFAGAFLMPRSSIAAFAPRAPSLPRLVKAKHTWNVSVPALAHRLHDVGVITDWQYWSLCRDIQQAGFRTEEPESAPREMSRVWEKVFSMLRDDGVSRVALAARFGWNVDELNALVFGLVLGAVPGQGGDSAADTPPRDRPKLQLL